MSGCSREMTNRQATHVDCLPVWGGHTPISPFAIRVWWGPPAVTMGRCHTFPTAATP